MHCRTALFRACCVIVVIVLAACGADPVSMMEIPITSAFASAVFVADAPSLDLADPAATPGGHPQVWLKEGWSSPEPRHIWAVGSRSTLAIVLPWTGASVLRLDCRPSAGRPDDPDPQIRVRLNGKPVGAFPLDRGWQTLEVSLPLQHTITGVNVLELGYAYHHSPNELGDGTDERSLAVCFRRIALEPRGTGATARDPQPPVVIDSTQPAVRIRRSGRIAVPLRLPPSARSLGLRLEAPASADSEWPTVQLSMMDLEAAITPLGTAEWRQSEAVSMAELTVPLDAWSSSTATLLIDVHGAVDPDITLTDPRITAVEPRREARRIAASTPRPDIVVLILDAARPDHMGCYGYHRDTTPRIDALARESLVFEDAFTLAPYTLCSIPTVITGLSFLRHGVTEPPQVLDDGAVTIAERLSAAGYATIALSSMPYNSPELNFHQGFDEFIEAWTGVPFEEGMLPERVTRLALERLERHRDDHPIFMMLHYLPPHEPYFPGAEHDRFGDTTYDGPVTPGWDTMAGTVKKMQLRPTDLDRLISLYDANLRRADAAIGALLDGLQARPRWQDTVVLIVADHGEAFFEHGELGHNSTVYDEMLRVPFILRVPDRYSAHQPSTTQLVSLADVTPTLLALAGLAPDPAFDGVRILPTAEELSRPHHRALISRTAGTRPTYGVRTLRWKAMLSPHEAPRLYDLSNDPGETVDVSGAHPFVVTAMRAVLRDEIRRATARGALEDTGDISDEQRRRLRSLGYL